MNVNKLLSEEDISQVVADLAGQVSRDYQSKELLIIGCLTGSFVFMADFIRNLTIPTNCDFIKVSSYEDRMSAGEIKLLMDVTLPLEGRDVLIVEDIVDTGQSLSFIMEHLRKKKPASLEACSLLYKESERSTLPKSAIRYLGRTVPDVFVVGYGIDYAQSFRELGYIGYIQKS